VTTSSTKRITRLENLVLASGHLLKTLQRDPSPATWTIEFAPFVQTHIRECIQVENSIKQRARSKERNRLRYEADLAEKTAEQLAHLSPLPPTKEPQQ